jgi:hypothetical protein
MFPVRLFPLYFLAEVCCEFALAVIFSRAHSAFCLLIAAASSYSRCTRALKAVPWRDERSLEQVLPGYKQFAKCAVTGEEENTMNTRQSLNHLNQEVLRWLLLGILLSSATGLFAQKPAGVGTGTTSLPDSPPPKPQGTSNPAMGTTSKLIGYISNKSIVFPDLATGEVPLSPGGKFKLFVNQSISPPYILAAGLNAAISQARDVPSAYGQGWDAYGGRYGAAIARASSNSFFGTFLFASALREDPRFFPQVHPSLWGSIKYSAVRVFVTRKDSGTETFNASGLLGPLSAETLANVYLPRSEQTGAKTAERFGTDLAWKFAANMFKNYWPTIFHGLGLNRLKVVPDPGSPNNPGGQPKN